jgi:hypothetical protein
MLMMKHGNLHMNKLLLLMPLPPVTQRYLHDLQLADHTASLHPQTARTCRAVAAVTLPLTQQYLHELQLANHNASLHPQTARSCVAAATAVTLPLTQCICMNFSWPIIMRHCTHKLQEVSLLPQPSLCHSPSSICMMSSLPNAAAIASGGAQDSGWLGSPVGTKLASMLAPASTSICTICRQYNMAVQ